MKSLLLTFFLILFFFNLQGQILSGYGVKLGAGISNQSWVLDPLDMSFNSKTGFSARFFANALNLHFFELEGELGYTRKGFSNSGPVTTDAQPGGTGEFISVSNSLDYLSISALARVKYNLGGFTPYLIAGPQLNFLLNKNIEKSWEITFNDFEKTNIGYSLGIGSEILNILPVSLLAEYRFEKDFNDNSKYSRFNIKNYSHVFLLGVKF